MGKFSLLCYGLSVPLTYFNLSHAILPSLCGRGNGPYRSYGPFTRLTLTTNFRTPHERIYDVEALEEKRQCVENQWLSYKKEMSKAYNKCARPRTLCIGDLVLKAIRHIQK